MCALNSRHHKSSQFPPQILRRNPHRQCTGGDIFHHHRVGTDRCIIADGHQSKDLRTRADVHAIAEFWCIVRPIQRFVSQRHALADDAVVADDGLAVNNDAVLMFAVYGNSIP